MRIAIWIVFALAFLVLNICLFVPLISYNMSWSEAALGIVPGALVSLICFALLVAGVGAKRHPRFRAPGLWTSALLWSLLVGGIVTYVANNYYQFYVSRVRERTVEALRTYDDRSSRRSADDAYLDASRARSHQLGMIFGFATLGFAGVAFVGLLISLVIALRKKSPGGVSATRGDDWRSEQNYVSSGVVSR
jgi:hypothetical protein